MQSDEEPASGAGAAQEASTPTLEAAYATIDRLRLDVVALRAENARLTTLLDAQGRNGGPAASLDGHLDPLDLTVTVGRNAPATARAAVADWLEGHVAIAVIDDARLLVSELVTNCVQHGHLAADAPIRITAHVAEGVLRLEVHDSGRNGTVSRRPPDPGGGYGLNLLELVATRWGVNRAGGTNVWFEMAA